ncbi:MAG: extracellular solute-binding protein [Clostridiales bacterium]|nr:extracellular solute-binding protein [Clostridiales bacterium]
MKNTKKVLATVMALGMSVSTFAACRPTNTRDGLTGDHVLRIYAQKAGFGIEWVEDLIEAFKNEAWVQEKYPGIQVGLTFNEQESFASNKLRAGKGVCTWDLLMGTYLKNETPIEDLTELVYNQTIPNEGVTFKSKITESMLKSFQVMSEGTDEVTYKAVPWSGGELGYVYNAELLDALGYNVPVTTDELITVSKAITATNNDIYNKGYAFISSDEGTAYWSYSFIPLLTQYMGTEGLSNFYNGIDEYGRRSNLIFQEKGRLRVLEFLEELYDYSSGIIYKSSDELAYMSAQLGFMKGNGIFMPMGSWFDNEMEALATQAKNSGEKIYDIRMMRVPVLSSIIEVLPEKSITNDVTLQAVVRAIDNGATSYEGVHQDDFNRVAQARAVCADQSHHDAVIPNFAARKDIAADFLLFMASDKGVETCYKANGSPNAYTYDIKTKNPELYNSLNSFEKSRVDMLYGNAVYNSAIYSPANVTRMVKYGGIGLLRIPTEDIYTYLSAYNVVKDAQTIYNDVINYWTADMFAQALIKAGY